MEHAAQHLGNIFMVFYNMRWDSEMMLGPPLADYPLDTKHYETPEANDLEYQFHLNNPFSLFVKIFLKSGREIRSSIFGQIHANLSTILGDDFACKPKAALFLKASKRSKEREACEDLHFLLGHNGSSRSPGTPSLCSYDPIPPILFENFDVDDPESFMRGDVYYQLIHVLSPDKEFPNQGISSTSLMRYNTYLAIKRILYEIEVHKIGGSLKLVYDCEVFPSYVPNSKTIDLVPADLTVESQYRMQPAVSKMVQAIAKLANPGAYTSPLSAQPTVPVIDATINDDDDFYATDVEDTTDAHETGLEGLLTAMSVSTSQGAGSAVASTSQLRSEETIRGKVQESTSSSDKWSGARARTCTQRSAAPAPAAAPATRCTTRSSKTT
ncbi:hypothetical protein FA15DRAFT_709287 [Coprinopsis marcescibilis]|uniref:Uncharacterized protein n=1 Tax=Coprinopsis marcescibilis TaxID=230819 RepID=A0A5C3KGF9_COPMA|nr:hypothetical protein FA15DRAFT_709287 [Coprinopsis marcescibilis]